MIALDTETNGTDFYHGARPFFVTTCTEDGEQEWFEWDVDPLTREVDIPSADIEATKTLLRATANWGKFPDEAVRERHCLALQNTKFDVHALASIGIDCWPWAMTRDTLVAGHLLASNHPHDLTSMAIEYLGIDIQPFEDALEIAVKECRTMVQQARLRIARGSRGRCERGGEEDVLATWRIAEAGLEEMPSAKETTWKYDTWLPRAIAKHLEYAADHPYWTVLRDYANADSSVTIALAKVMHEELNRRGQWPLYLEKLGNLPVLFEMENRGTTVLMPALNTMKEEYASEIEENVATCAGIAAEYNYDLELPKAGNNKSLLGFVFDTLELPVIKRTDKGNPSFDKGVMDEYRKTLDGESLEFIKALSSARKRQKSNEFLNAYATFGIPAPGEILVLHPSVNPTATATTRLSMSHPNLQQVSRQESQCETCLGDGCDECGHTGEDLHSVRKVFGPAPGREWWSADAKNIELRIPAYESGEPDLIALFERPDDPPFYGSQHMLNMSIVYDDVWAAEMKAVGRDKVGPHCKKKYGSTIYHFVKCGGLAMQYQCGEETADRTFRRRGGFRKLKSHFRKVDALNAKYVAMAEKRGYVETLPDRSLGMTRGYPLLCARGDYGRVLATVPLNYHVQGTAGWWMVRAMNRCRARLLEWKKKIGFDGYIALTVHDELVFDLPKRGNPTGDARREKEFGGVVVEDRPSNLWRIRILQKLMQQGGTDIGIPTPVSIEYHETNWADGVTL